MTAIADSLVNYSRTIVSGPLFECPFCQPTSHCPIRPLRELEAEERLEHVMKLSKEEIVDLAERHFNCVQRRANLAHQMKRCNSGHNEASN